MKEIYENKDSETNFDENNDSSVNNSSSNSQQAHKSHPLAYHTSRILEDDIDGLKILKINTSNSKDSSLNDIDIGFDEGES